MNTVASDYTKKLWNRLIATASAIYGIKTAALLLGGGGDRIYKQLFWLLLGVQRNNLVSMN
jgi:hypothetical protein